MCCALNKVFYKLLSLKAQYNEAKRLTERSKEKAKQSLTEAHHLSGVTNPNDITSEKQAV